VADSGVGDWGTCPGTKGGCTRGERQSKNNENLHNKKHVGAQSGNLAQSTRNHKSASGDQEVLQGK